MKEQKINTGLGWLEKILQLEEKYGFWKILKSLGVMVLVIWVIIISLNPTILIEKYQKIVEDIHIEELAKTNENGIKINAELTTLLNTLGCERTFFIEYHNSIKSVEGYPWQYGSMNYEQVADNVEYYISDEFTEFITTKYSMIPYINSHNIFYGDLSDIRKIDKRLGTILQASNIENIALIGIEGEKLPIGILGIAYSEDIDEQRVLSELRKTAIKIGRITYN